MKLFVKAETQCTVNKLLGLNVAECIYPFTCSWKKKLIKQAQHIVKNYWLASWGHSLRWIN